MRTFAADGAGVVFADALSCDRADGALVSWRA